MFYALSDSFTGDNPREITAGFANTKCVICFKTRKERDEWVADTRLTTARALTRSEALSYADSPGWTVVNDRDHGAKIARIYGTDGDYHVIRKSQSRHYG